MAERSISTTCRGVLTYGQQLGVEALGAQRRGACGGVKDEPSDEVGCAPEGCTQCRVVGVCVMKDGDARAAPCKAHTGIGTTQVRMNVGEHDSHVLGPLQLSSLRAAQYDFECG